MENVIFLTADGQPLEPPMKSEILDHYRPDTPEKDRWTDHRNAEEKISGRDHRNDGTLVGMRPDREKEILGFFKDIFIAKLNHFSGNFQHTVSGLQG